MKIKPIKKIDIPNLYKLWKESGLPIKHRGRDSVDHLTKEIDGEQSFFLKALSEDDKIIGAVLGTHDGRKGWINRQAVHPNNRGEGVAKQLISEVEKRLDNLGIFIIASLIEEYNTDSMSLFEGLGYERHTEIFYFTKRRDKEI